MTKNLVIFVRFSKDLIWSALEKTHSISTPNAYAGIEKPIKTKPLEIISNLDPCFKAFMIPRGMHTKYERINPVIPKVAENKNEIHDFPHPRSIIALDSIAKRWGSVSGFQAAEAFTLIRKLQKTL